MRIGVISDTHGLLRPEAIQALQGAEHILHAGDVGDPAILDALSKIAPVTAIRGNIDEGGACGHLPATELIELGGHSIYMLHDVKKLDLNPEAAGIAAVIFGHSHKPACGAAPGRALSESWQRRPTPIRASRERRVVAHRTAWPECADRHTHRLSVALIGQGSKHAPARAVSLDQAAPPGPDRSASCA